MTTTLKNYQKSVRKSHRDKINERGKVAIGVPVHSYVAGNFTPQDLEVLLHYHTLPCRHARHNDADVEKSRNYFLRNKIIEPSGEPDVYYTTDKGKAWLKIMCSTPFPELLDDGKKMYWYDKREPDGMKHCLLAKDGLQ